MSQSNEELEQVVHVALETLHDCDRRNNGFAALTDLCARLRRAERIEKAAAKVADWLERNAEKEEQTAAAARDLPAFADSCRHDAKQKRIAVRDLRAALQNEEG